MQVIRIGEPTYDNIQLAQDIDAPEPIDLNFKTIPNSLDDNFKSAFGNSSLSEEERQKYKFHFTMNTEDIESRIENPDEILDQVGPRSDHVRFKINITINLREVDENIFRQNIYKYYVPGWSPITREKLLRLICECYEDSFDYYVSELMNPFYMPLYYQISRITFCDGTVYVDCAWRPSGAYAPSLGLDCVSPS
jgi:hypothetical protein